MADNLDSVLAEFTALVQQVRRHRDVPCVCDLSTTEAHEETLAGCISCHANSIFDETMEHARGVVQFLEGMADRRPHSHTKRPRKQKPNNVVRFQPLSTTKQPNAKWKY